MAVGALMGGEMSGRLEVVIMVGMGVGGTAGMVVMGVMRTILPPRTVSSGRGWVAW